jgi:3-dehydroquinate synthase
MKLFADVYHEDETFAHLKAWLQEKHDISSLFILVDENTHEHCLPLLLNTVEPLQRVEILEIAAGEEHKTLEIATQLWSGLTELKADRKSLLINLGGGVICDLGGFVASCYMRGIRFINLPTTLLAQVDAAHGGKTGVDLDGYKNQVGLLSPPMATFVYPGFCESLDERQFISGFAECVKHSLIADHDLWQSFLLTGKPSPELAPEFLKESIRIKQRIVEEDPAEKGTRKILNFGHTVGHALETFSLRNDSDPLLHGEAVAMGMIAELYLSTHACGFSQADLLIAAKYISEVFPIRPVEERHFNAILELMQHDKKNEYGELLLSLLESPGKAIYDQTAESYWVFEALAYLNQYAKARP